MDRNTLYLLRLLDETFDGPAWHGPALATVVRGFSARQAAWRPVPGRRSAWEIVLHCAYWEHRVHERVAPGTAVPFPRVGANWPDLPEEVTTARWRADVALLKSVHAALRAAVASLSASSLNRPAPGQKKTRLENIIGVCCHDVYHAGQIRLLHRIQRSGFVEPGHMPGSAPATGSRSGSSTESSAARRSPVARRGRAKVRAAGGTS